MTTLKPQLVRADTLDLQAHEGPSAKDHTRQPAHGDPYGYGPAAPHQAQTLRHAEHEAYRQQHTSPRQSEEDQHGPFSDSQRFYDDPEDEVEDEHMNHLHGANGATDHERDYEDAEASDSHDEDMDDDLMDKISSSPSIEDGKYSLPPWPPRMDSVDRGASPAPLSTPTRGNSSSSPFACPPLHSPIPFPQEEDSYPASHHGEEPSKRHGIYNVGHSPYRTTSYAASSNSLLPEYAASFQDDYRNDYRNDLDAAELAKYLLPIDDPLLDDTFDQLDEGFYDDDDDDDGVWEDEDVNIPHYETSSDDSQDLLFTDDSRFIDSGWGGECLREIEDIDFEFVYALHTFVATVEGQANATKGDTMVLLDDSNSYWWLVRVVKDGSIGYLPAEHIETPTERLARLNKHRNIDLSASMLGDNPEKSKNPLKKAMRRRNAKTVQFAPPTYYEPSDVEYSDEEDGDDSQLEGAEAGPKAEEPEPEQARQADRADAQGHVTQIMGPANGIKRIASNESLDEEPSSPVKDLTPEPLQPSVQHSDSVSRSRNGVVRNTDSFFKDDSAETKKISLTPRLLRGDSGSTAASNDQEVRQRPSMETFDQLLADNEKPKEQSQQSQQQQPKKEKKGMLSGLFKRKDKAPKSGKSESDRPDKTSEESLRHSPQSKDSLESLTKVDQAPERKPSKLQKQPPVYTSPKSSPTEARPPQRDMQPVQGNAPPAPSGPAPAPPTVRPVEQSEPEQQRFAQQPQAQASSQTPNRFPSLQEKRSIFSPITDALKSSPSSSDTGEAPIKPVVSKRAKERFAIDTSDSEDEATPTAGPQLNGQRSVSPLNDVQSSHRRNDSGMQISPIEPSVDRDSVFESATKPDPKTEEIAIPSEEEPEAVREVTPTDLEHTASTSKASPSTVTTHTPSTSRSTPTWSDASLRNYMDNDQDIKDLLIIVHDKSNITPVGPDHPLMANLFSTERTKLTDMQGQLDTMLMSWMSRKNSHLLLR